ncbi:hypothetical protein E8E13_006147 [Curvularia kusanoi]|uniref:Uncharacterized protein n=1 Tax=Curvularia kusanoi TaxID=90978 RepID=A0A9P4TJZ8_CURKU|nr:hypothetical protein E8E13_006147 [Curvularia kusanoi]
MIVTIDDYRGNAEPEQAPSSEQIKDEDDDSPFTVARAGLLKLRLQALNKVLARTPLAQHRDLRLEETVQSVLPRTYVSGSEEVYFIVKDLSWPSKIPEVFISAYREVCECQPFTNKYIPRNYIGADPRPFLGSPTSQFAPTFSTIRPLLRQIDASCCTKLSNFFDISNDRSGYPYDSIVGLPF